MKAVLKNVYFYVLDDIVDKYNNRVHRTIKMKSIDVISDSYAKDNENSNETRPKFIVGDPVRISKFKILLRDIPKTDVKKFLLLPKLKMQFCSHT